ncbi:deoxyribose-phosphate aldolase 2 [Zalerion maritima]|uniref:Deoxyribose-phosphate aldolase 2 n=1 Tax=Zalerion maritima TaxID=339359 RepID=A0AAD5RGS7_9PEZI|nr:deoxyribose-phosphate aldolase 2 [Zalerion maritima]
MHQSNLNTTKPSAHYVPPQPAGRPWTLSIAIPTSILSDLETREQRTRLLGQVGRALAVFCIDEVVIFDDREESYKSNASDPTTPDQETDDPSPYPQNQGFNQNYNARGRGGRGGGSYHNSNYHSRKPDHGTDTSLTNPLHYISHLLSYLECPPFMRRSLFPIHSNLQLAGILPSLDMPHHPNLREPNPPPYREGVTIEGMTSSGTPGTVVDIGLRSMVEIPNSEIPPKTRVTLHFPELTPSSYSQAGRNSGFGYSHGGGRHTTNAIDSLLSSPATAVSPSHPREASGYYWGYTVRTSPSLSAVFTECPFDGGYDISIGTSERGSPIAKTFPGYRVLDFKHLIIVFGGPNGLEFAAGNDSELAGMSIKGGKTKELFDHWVNVLPSQGSRTIRTEEALFIALTGLRKLWDSS